MTSKKSNSELIPTSGLFDFVPKTFEHLKGFTVSANWSSQSNTINVVLKETAEFDVIRWIEYLADKYRQREKTPFSDVTEGNNCKLTLKDVSGQNDLAQIVFLNPRLVEHGCSWSNRNLCKIDENSMQHNPLLHYVTLYYESYEFIAFDEENITACDDKEWKKHNP